MSESTMATSPPVGDKRREEVERLKGIFELPEPIISAVLSNCEWSAEKAAGTLLEIQESRDKHRSQAEGSNFQDACRQARSILARISVNDVLQETQGDVSLAVDRILKSRSEVDAAAAAAPPRPSLAQTLHSKFPRLTLEQIQRVIDEQGQVQSDLHFVVMQLTLLDRARKDERRLEIERSIAASATASASASASVSDSASDSASASASASESASPSAPSVAASVASSCAAASPVVPSLYPSLSAHSTPSRCKKATTTSSSASLVYQLLGKPAPSHSSSSSSVVASSSTLLAAPESNGASPDSLSSPQLQSEGGMDGSVDSLSSWPAESQLILSRAQSRMSHAAAADGSSVCPSAAMSEKLVALNLPQQAALAEYGAAIAEQVELEMAIREDPTAQLRVATMLAIKELRDNPTAAPPDTLDYERLMLSATQQPNDESDLALALTLRPELAAKGHEEKLLSSVADPDPVDLEHRHMISALLSEADPRTVNVMWGTSNEKHNYTLAAYRVDRNLPEREQLSNLRLVWSRKCSEPSDVVDSAEHIHKFYVEEMGSRVYGSLRFPSAPYGEYKFRLLDSNNNNTVIYSFPPSQQLFQVRVAGPCRESIASQLTQRVIDPQTGEEVTEQTLAISVSFDPAFAAACPECVVFMYEVHDASRHQPEHAAFVESIADCSGNHRAQHAALIRNDQPIVFYPPKSGCWGFRLFERQPSGMLGNLFGLLTPSSSAYVEIPEARCKVMAAGSNRLEVTPLHEQGRIDLHLLALDGVNLQTQEAWLALFGSVCLCERFDSCHCNLTDYIKRIAIPAARCELAFDTVRRGTYQVRIIVKTSVGGYIMIHRSHAFTLDSPDVMPACATVAAPKEGTSVGTAFAIGSAAFLALSVAVDLVVSSMREPPGGNRKKY